MKKLFLAMAALLAGLTSCTKDAPEQGLGTPSGDITVRFSLSLPGSGDVVYPKSRAVQEEAEYAIKKLKLYEFAVNDGQATFHQMHDVEVTPTSAGNYTFALTLDAQYYQQKRKFVFVANDASIAEPALGDPIDKFMKTLATVQLADNDNASKLAPETGIVMSGMGKVGGQEEIVLASSFSCDVELTRAVARVDVINNTPNMVIKDIKMTNAAAKGYVMPQDASPKAPGDPDPEYIDNFQNNSDVALGDTYDDQYNSGSGLQKVFYMYERENSDDDHSTIEISYTINGSVKGSLTVPFRKTGDAQDWVNIQRNHLYKIVLGNGQAITTDKVEVQFFDEDWTVIEIPSDVDCEQDKMNAALKVSMFTPYNVKSANLPAKTVTAFHTTLDLNDYYVSFSDLKANGLTDASAVLSGPDGKKYRLPTEGELNLLLPMWTENNVSPVRHPWWNDNPQTNTTSIVMTDEEFTETIYLKNKQDGYPDNVTSPDEIDGEYRVSGKSWLKKSPTFSTVNYSGQNYNVAPVYGLRFKGTSQYAAYRWESRMIGSNPLERYLSIKIKALKKDDTNTTITTVASESFWENGYIEFKFPASGYYPAGGSSAISSRGVNGYCWSSSYWSGAGDSSQARSLLFHLHDARVIHGDVGHRIPLRLVRVEE